jgi:hypothetical protein
LKGEIEMKRSTDKYLPYLKRLLALIALVIVGCHTPPEPEASPPGDQAQQTGCTPEQRREALRATQAQVLQAAPQEVESLKQAIEPGGPLAGWRLSHGHVVIAGGGAVPLDNMAAKDPMPPLLLYTPSSTSSPADWLDFDGPDGPYRLVGWGYIAPYQPGSDPPGRRCVGASEWVVHEAGWHLMDGGMLLTPGATTEPPRPQHNVGIYFWHPRAWDIHYWIGEDGVPTISFNKPKAPDGGIKLPADAFFSLVDSRKQPLPKL